MILSKLLCLYQSNINYHSNKQNSTTMADMVTYSESANATQQQQTSLPTAGLVNISNPLGGDTKGVIIKTGLVQENINNIIQISIDNTGVGATAQLVRIGSWAAEPDSYAQYGLTPGAADNGIIEDQNGVGCVFVSGFSKIVCSKPVIVSNVKIMAGDNDIQLNQALKYRALQLDGSVDETVVNIAHTAGRGDNRTNLVELSRMFILDAQQFLEYRALAGKSFDLFLLVTGFSNAETFIPLLSK